jgi:Ca2+-binding EF-hand superfamily protein
MKGTAIILGFGALVLAGGLAHGDERMARFMERVDANGDGAISRDEARVFRAERFGRLDANGDGKVTMAEMEDAARARVAERVAKRFEMLDANGDGSVDRAEFDARADRRFDRWDENGDGVVTEEEIRAMRGRHRRGG